MNFQAPGAANLELERVLAILRRRWWVIVLVAVLVTGATFAFSEHQQKKYTATASVLLFTDTQINPQSGLPVTSSSATDVTPAAQATAVQLLGHQPAAARATADSIGRGVTAGEVAGAISVSEQGQTNIADVSATTTSPSLSSAIANTYVNEYIARQRAQTQATLRRGLNEVQLQLAALSAQQKAGPNGQSLADQAESLRILIKVTNGGIQVVTPAFTSSSPSSPKVARNTALGLVLGLLLGLGIAFLLERLDRRMKNTEEIGDAYRLPLLASVPQNKLYVLPPQLENGGPRGHTEVFKLLRTYLRYFNVDRELRLLVVASAAPGDGKTTIAHNLAEAAQETGTRTLLLDADLRQPRLARHYGVPEAPGLSELLVGATTAAEATRSVPITSRTNGSGTEVSLDVLVAGNVPPNPTELSQSRAMTDVLAWAAEHYDLVVIDTPPLSVVSDAIALLRHVDGVVLVSQVGKNTRDAASLLRQRLEGVNAPLLGVVANGVKAKGRDGYGYGYGYGYQEATAQASANGDLEVSAKTGA